MHAWPWTHACADMHNWVFDMRVCQFDVLNVVINGVNYMIAFGSCLHEVADLDIRAEQLRRMSPPRYLELITMTSKSCALADACVCEWKRTCICTYILVHISTSLSGDTHAARAAGAHEPRRESVSFGACQRRCAREDARQAALHSFVPSSAS
jgi:hypothetical protein